MRLPWPMTLLLYAAAFMLALIMARAVSAAEAVEIERHAFELAT